MQHRFITYGTHLYKGDNPEYRKTILGFLPRKIHPETKLKSTLKVLKDHVKVLAEANMPSLEPDVDHLVALSLFLDIFNHRVLTKYNDKAIARLERKKEIYLINSKIKNLAPSSMTDLSDNEKAKPIESLRRIIINAKQLPTANMPALLVAILTIKLKLLEEFYHSYQLELVEAEIKKINGEVKNITTAPTLKQLYLKYLELDPKCATAYLDLAKLLSNEERITLRNGVTMTKRKLLLKSIEQNPDFAPLHIHLAATLHPAETIRMPYGKKTGDKQLLLKAIKLDPNNASSYYHLALTIHPLQVFNYKKTCVTKQQLI